MDDMLTHDSEDKVAVAAVQLVRLLNTKPQTLSCDCMLADVIESTGQAVSDMLTYDAEGKVAVAAVQLLRLLNPKPQTLRCGCLRADVVESMCQDMLIHNTKGQVAVAAGEIAEAFLCLHACWCCRH